MSCCCHPCPCWHPQYWIPADGSAASRIVLNDVSEGLLKLYSRRAEDFRAEVMALRRTIDRIIQEDPTVLDRPPYRDPDGIKRRNHW